LCTWAETGQALLPTGWLCCGEACLASVLAQPNGVACQVGAHMGEPCRGKNPLLACLRRPSVAPRRSWHASGEARRGGLHGNKVVWRLGFGVKRERGSPANALHGGGDSNSDIDGSSSDQRSRCPVAELGSCLALPHSLGRHAWGRTVAGGMVRR
jgi:hypothetical protein